MPAGLVYLFVSKFRATFAEYKEEAEAMNKNSCRLFGQKINTGYLEYIKSQTELNVLIIDVLIKISVKIKKTIFCFRRNQEKNCG
jgi:hypothetical protein